MSEEMCHWKYDEEYDSWRTGCDNLWILLDGTPTDNHMKFCPYCGKQIKERTCSHPKTY